MLLALLLHALSASAALALPAIGAIVADVNEVARNKREPGRSMTFSGFMPYGGGRMGGGGGLSAFASSGDFGGYYPQPQDNKDHQGDDLQPPSEGETGGWGKGGGAGAGEGAEPEADGDESEERPPRRQGKKNKKKHTTNKERDEDEEEYEYERGAASRGGGGDAAATFNAWFPIVLGSWGGPGDQGEYPGRSGHGGHGSGHGSGSGSGSGYERPASPASHTTVVANSVSHGRSGVAASHAVAYGAGAPQPQSHHQRQKRMAID